MDLLRFLLLLPIRGGLRLVAARLRAAAAGGRRVVDGARVDGRDRRGRAPPPVACRRPRAARGRLGYGGYWFKHRPKPPGRDRQLHREGAGHHHLRGGRHRQAEDHRASARSRVRAIGGADRTGRQAGRRRHRDDACAEGCMGVGRRQDAALHAGGRLAGRRARRGALRGAPGVRAAGADATTVSLSTCRRSPRQSATTSSTRTPTIRRRSRRCCGCASTTRSIPPSSRSASASCWSAATARIRPAALHRRLRQDEDERMGPLAVARDRAIRWWRGSTSTRA